MQRTKTSKTQETIQKLKKEDINLLFRLPWTESQCSAPIQKADSQVD
jgi:hypothetical protein